MSDESNNVEEKNEFQPKKETIVEQIYNQRKLQEMGLIEEKAKGNVSYSKIKADISAEESKEKNNNEGNTIDLQI